MAGALVVMPPLSPIPSLLLKALCGTVVYFAALIALNIQGIQSVLLVRILQK
jgi:hypothetical protein